ncbi:hypothetical protein [Peribacillus butanolivorans]|uniref:Transposase n=1 Tax=Peribacillus butanolivorans TaxID=421767 RepID=A0ABM6XFA1_9BACI|nr:hypothetical protein [Peribacillus butanolivorans]AXN37039.1 hypothetical protein DTO10_00640 [Peribacillus butanolivorans]QNU04491.1 hypothetical protein GM240_11365 [Peribacillus butanolivorans]
MYGQYTPKIKILLLLQVLGVRVYRARMISKGGGVMKANNRIKVISSFLRIKNKYLKKMPKLVMEI